MRVVVVVELENNIKVIKIILNLKKKKTALQTFDKLSGEFKRIHYNSYVLIYTVVKVPAV